MSFKPKFLSWLLVLQFDGLIADAHYVDGSARSAYDDLVVGGGMILLFYRKMCIFAEKLGWKTCAKPKKLGCKLCL